MDKKNEIQLIATEKPENEEYNTNDEPNPHTRASVIIRGIFTSAMCLISLVITVCVASFIIGKLDISAEKLTLTAIKVISGREAVLIEAETEVKSETVAENIESEAETLEKAETADNKQPEYTITPVKIELSNETPYEPNTQALIENGRVIPTLNELYKNYGENEPVVLLLHTHGSESYSDTSDDNYRSSDKDKNVVSLGDKVAEILEKNGISTIHSRELFDSPDFNMAYYNASLAIKKFIAEYPSISYIIDIHRDSIIGSDGEYYAPTATLNGKVKAAQMMFVIGTDHGGSGHVGWQDNLTLAARLQCTISEENEGLMRHINLRSASFNQQYRKGSLIVEIGSCASTHNEAMISAEIFAEQLAREIIG